MLSMFTPVSLVDASAFLLALLGNEGKDDSIEDATEQLLPLVEEHAQIALSDNVHL